MKNRAAVILAGVVIAFEAVSLFRSMQRRAQPAQREPRPEPRLQDIDLNSASTEQLASLGLDGDIIGRVVDNRPYRNKLDLLSRIIVTEDVYESIKDKILVSNADEPVKVA